jgi:hypothetical protein
MTLSCIIRSTPQLYN